MILSSLPKLEQVRAANETIVRRQGNVDAFWMEEEAGEIGLCHLPFVLPISLPKGYPTPQGPAPFRIPFNIWRTQQSLIAALLAAHHLNTGDGRVIPEVEGLNERCNIRFSTEALDSMLMEKQAVQHALKLMARTSQDRQASPCLFLGPYRSSASVAMSTVTTTQQYPIFSPASQSTSLDDKGQHPYFGRFITSDDGTISALVRFIREELGVQHLGVIYTSDDFGNSMARDLQAAVRQYAPDLKLQLDTISPDPAADPKDAVDFLKKTQFKYFLTNAYQLETFILEAYNQGIAGTGEHNWLVHGASTFPDLEDLERGSPLHLATRGFLRFGPYVMPSLENEPYRQFNQAFQDLASSPSDLEYIRSKFPQYDDSPLFPLSPFNDEAFWDMNARENTMELFTYDTVIAAGLSACNITATNGTYFNGPDLYQGILNTDFMGTTNHIRLDPKTGTRTPQSGSFVTLNIYEQAGEGDRVTLDARPSHFFQNNHWVQLQPLLLNDGTTAIPPDLPLNSVEMNYLPLGLRIFLWILAAFIVGLSLGCAIWTHRNIKERVISASQPIFLYIICIGCFFMGLNLIAAGIDDGLVKDQQVLDMFCMFGPWTVALGVTTIFSSFFSKTWRINRIFFNPGMRRIKVTAKDVMAPLVFFVGVQTLILSLWTALDPKVYDRVIDSSDEFGRPTSSHAYCASNNQYAFFVPSVVLAVGVMAKALYQAYKARAISLEFAESESIFRSLFVSFLVSAIGIPVLVIANEDPTASTFVFSCIVFVIPSTVLLFMFLPKYRYIKQNKGKGSRNLKNNIRGFVKASSQAPKMDGSTGNISISGDSMWTPMDDSSSRVNTSARDGLRIADSPEIRERMKKENAELKEEVATLRKENAELRRRTTEPACKEMVWSAGSSGSKPPDEAAPGPVEEWRDESMESDESEPLAHALRPPQTPKTTNSLSNILTKSQRWLRFDEELVCVSDELSV